MQNKTVICIFIGFLEKKIWLETSLAHTLHNSPPSQKKDRFIEYVKISVGSRTTYVDQTLKSLACEGQQEGEAALWSYILKQATHATSVLQLLGTKLAKLGKDPEIIDTKPQQPPVSKQLVTVERKF